MKRGEKGREGKVGGKGRDEEGRKSEGRGRAEWDAGPAGRHVAGLGNGIYIAPLS